MSGGAGSGLDGKASFGMSGDEPRSLRPLGILVHGDKHYNQAENKEKDTPDNPKPRLNHTRVSIVMFCQSINYIKEYHSLRVL